MNLKVFLAELRRRNVYRAAAAYGALSWLLIQIATQVFPFFNIPNWTVRYVIVLLLLGFPLAMSGAWIFEWTPHGLKRTDEVAPSESIGRSRGRKLDFFIIGVLLIVIAILAFQRFAPPAREKSIAVLPFENLSTEKENGFLADGIQDDLLTNLAKIKDLRVISRTSVMQYRNAETRNIQEIGKALNAAHILEGSVRKVGDRIAVNVQLIDAQTDRHLWAERYDRKIADAVSMEGELATEIAEALRATLTPEEKVRVEQKPTQNADAYVLYLRALPYEQGSDTLLQDYKKAEQLYSEAIALDPDFALAHAHLGSTCAGIYHFYEPLDSWKIRARTAAETALRLQPNLAEGHFALGQYIYWIDADYDGALAEFKVAQRLAPSNAPIGLLVGAIYRRRGEWQECLATFEKSQLLDPRNSNIIRNVMFVNSALRRWPEAARAAEKYRAIAPDSLTAKIQSAYIEFQWKGNVTAIAKSAENIPASEDPDGSVTAARWEGAMLERDFFKAKQILSATPLNEFSYFNGGMTPKGYMMGCTALALGDDVLARESLELASKALEVAVAEAPTSADRHAALGICYAFMGRKDDAIREGQKAVELKPESKDAQDGPLMSCCLALIYARVDENALAIQLIDRLLRTPGAVDSAPYSMTQNDLKYRWEWDPLRAEPAFQKLISTQ